VIARRLGLAAVLLVSLGLSLLWLVRVPFFESPDENAHADYAFTLYSLRAPVPLAGRRTATNVHPLVAYLEGASDFEKLHYNPDGRVPAEYGSPAFRRTVDAGAPAVPRDFLEHNGGRVPYVARAYSYGYYALDALAIWAGALLSNGSATAEFFAARAFNMLLLLCSLVLAYATFRELRLPYRSALALTATIGLFPLTSWVSAYVQPDNLSFTAVALALYLAVRLRRESAGIGAWAALGLAFGLLALTKAQYYVVVVVPVLAWLAVRVETPRASWRTWAVRIGLLLLPSLLAAASVHGSVVGADKQVTGGASFYGNPLGAAAHLGLVPFVQTAVGLLAKAFLTTFYDGLSFVGYWGGFSWDDTKIDFGSDEITRLVYALIGACSLLVAALVVSRLVFGVWPRLFAIGRRRGALSAARVALRDVHLNAYLCFAVTILGLNVITGGGLGSAGRYWLPLIVSALLCATRCAPRALPRRYRRPVAVSIGGALLAYSVVAAAASPASIEARFYRPPAHPLDAERDALIRHVGGLRPPAPGARLRFAANAIVEVDGVALDSHNTAPVDYVDVAVDGVRTVRARYGLPEPAVASSMNDDRLLHTGYVARLDLSKLAPGDHEIGLLVGEPGRASPWKSLSTVPITLEAPASGAQTGGMKRRAPR
jgi:hypothetical protein